MTPTNQVTELPDGNSKKINSLDSNRKQSTTIFSSTMDKEGEDLFTDLFNVTDPETEVHETNWVESLYKTINDPVNDSPLELFTENVMQASSPTIPIDSPSMHMFVHSDDELGNIPGIADVSKSTCKNVTQFDSNTTATTSKQRELDSTIFSKNEEPPSFTMKQNNSITPSFEEPPTFASAQSIPAIQPLTTSQLINKLSQTQAQTETQTQTQIPSRLHTHQHEQQLQLQFHNNDQLPSTHSLNSVSNANSNTTSNSKSITDSQSSPITQSHSQQSRIYELLRDGLKEYTKLLIIASPDSFIRTRTDFLVLFLKDRENMDIRSKTINDYFSQARKDETENHISNKIGNFEVMKEIRDLLNESNRRRKCYNKRKSFKDNKKSGTPVTDNSSPLDPIIPTEKFKKSLTISKLDKIKGGLINLIKIGAYLNQRTKSQNFNQFEAKKLDSIADLGNVSKVREDEKYIFQLRTKNLPLKSCIEDIYGISLNITHSLTYSQVPLAMNQKLSIDLENDRMVSYIETTIDLSELLFSKSFQEQEPEQGHGYEYEYEEDQGQRGQRQEQYPSQHSHRQTNFTKFLQLKSITRIYDDGKLIYRKCDPVTGYFPGESSSNAKIILPLQAKFWAGLINDYHNGIIEENKFSNIKITHTLIPNDDLIKFKTGTAPIYSFIWEFIINTDNKFLPHSVVVYKAPAILEASSYNNSHINTITNTNVNNNHPIMFTTPTPNNLRSTIRRTITEDSSLITSTPLNSKMKSTLLLPSQNNSLRGHKRTRSRSMNEIDAMQFQFAINNNNNNINTNTNNNYINHNHGVNNIHNNIINNINNNINSHNSNHNSNHNNFNSPSMFVETFRPNSSNDASPLFSQKTAINGFARNNGNTTISDSQSQFQSQLKMQPPAQLQISQIPQPQEQFMGSYNTSPLQFINSAPALQTEFNINSINSIHTAANINNNIIGNVEKEKIKRPSLSQIERVKASQAQQIMLNLQNQKQQQQ